MSVSDANSPDPVEGAKRLHLLCRVIRCESGQRRGHKFTLDGPNDLSWLWRAFGDLIDHLKIPTSSDPGDEVLTLGELHVQVQAYRDYRVTVAGGGQ